MGATYSQNTHIPQKNENFPQKDRGTLWLFVSAVRRRLQHTHAEEALSVSFTAGGGGGGGGDGGRAGNLGLVRFVLAHALERMMCVCVYGCVQSPASYLTFGPSDQLQTHTPRFGGGG